MKTSMSILRKPLHKVLGDPVRREIKRYEGVVALIKARNGALSPAQIRTILEQTAGAGA